MKKSLCLLMLVSSLSWADDPKPAAQPPKKADPKPEVKPKLIRPVPIQPAGQGLERPELVKRYIESYQSRCIRYFDDLARAGSAEEKARIQSLQPNPRMLVSMVGRIVAANQKDEAAFEALAVLAKYADIPAMSDAMGKIGTGDDAKKIDPFELLLEHHSGNAKLADICLSLPANPATQKFLGEVFAKSTNSDVKGKIGYRLGSELMRTNEAAAEKLLQAMVDDKSLAKHMVNLRQNAHEWAEANLREIKLLGIGKVLPDVNGETLDGKKAAIADFRGKVVVLDIWATWCGPCRAMIPHEREMVKRLDGKPFVLLSVSCDDKKETLTEFLKKEEMPWQHWWVGRGGEFSKTMNIRFYPTIYVLDAKGTIRHKNIRGEKLEEAVVKLIEEMK